MARVKVGPALPDTKTLDVEIAHLRNSARRLAPSWGEMIAKPVTLPPGRPRLATSPSSTGSPIIPITMGTVVVAFVAAIEATPLSVTITSTGRSVRVPRRRSEAVLVRRARNGIGVCSSGLQCGRACASLPETPETDRVPGRRRGVQLERALAPVAPTPSAATPPPCHRSMWLCFDSITLWHFDAAEWAPSTTSNSTILNLSTSGPVCPRKPT
jgi:hypothetical protein